ncbi:MAG: transcriptional repressor LexA [Planctomycetota bacterium]|nr:transcriptional repressor LexA [Planctomycetota bacterium]
MLSGLEEQENKPILTSRQQEIYDFLRDLILNRGYGPTVREIGAQFGIRSPNGVMCHLKALEKKGLITRESHMSRAIQLADSPHDRMRLPVFGNITRNKQLQSIDGEFVDFATLFDTDGHFALRVKGDGFAGDQIQAGDHVVVNRQTSCKNGDLIVAVVNGKEASISRYYRDREGVRLESGSSESVHSNDVEIVGVVAGVIRQF